MFEALGVLENSIIFSLGVILFTFVFAVMSKSFLYAAYAAFLVYLSIALLTKLSLLMNSLYIIIVGVTILSAFQIFNMTQENQTGV